MTQAKQKKNKRFQRRSHDHNGDDDTRGAKKQTNKQTKTKTLKQEATNREVWR